jgi:hypothetical protein
MHILKINLIFYFIFFLPQKQRKTNKTTTNSEYKILSCCDFVWCGLNATMHATVYISRISNSIIGWFWKKYKIWCKVNYSGVSKNQTISFFTFLTFSDDNWFLFLWHGTPLKLREKVKKSTKKNCSWKQQQLYGWE